jgi:hypothetical protein
MQPGRGRFVLLFPFVLTLAGALTFVTLARLKRREQQAAGQDIDGHRPE